MPLFEEGYLNSSGCQYDVIVKFNLFTKSFTDPTWYNT